MRENGIDNRELEEIVLNGDNIKGLSLIRLSIEERVWRIENILERERRKVKHG